MAEFGHASRMLHEPGRCCSCFSVLCHGRTQAGRPGELEALLAINLVPGKVLRDFWCFVF